MNVLIVAATEMELGAFRSQCDTANVLITGVGMVATAYALTRHLQSHKYDLVLQAGVAGAYDSGIPLGGLVFVTSEQYGDLGAEDHDRYLDLFEMGLLAADTHPFANGKLSTPLLPVHDKIKLPHVSGLTINTVSGREHTIQRRAEKFGCAVETMEGAAFHEVCLRENVAFAQVRAISNYVIPRDKSQWKMKEAIINLNNWLIDFIKGV